MKYFIHKLTIGLFVVLSISFCGCDEVNKLIEKAKQLIPDSGYQYNAEDEREWAQGTSNKMRPNAPKGVNAPNKVPKGCYYSFSWNAPNATQCCVNWSFFNKNGEKKEGTSNWIDKLEHTWRVPNEEGVMYVNVYAKNLGGQSQEPLAFEVKVIGKVDDKGIEILSNDDYLSIFSNSSAYNNKFAYWCAKASRDAYESNPYDAMSFLGFKNHKEIDRPALKLKAFVSSRKIENPINKTIVIISIRGTKKITNWLEDVVAYPIGWENELQILPDFFNTTPVAHGGFYLCTNAIWEKIKTYPDYSKNALFIVTGHSLGGAIAELLSLKLKDAGIPAQNIICYGFASPPVGNEKLKKYANDKGLGLRIYKIMNTMDPVPELGIYAFTLADKNNVKTFTAMGEQLGHKMESVYLNHILETLEKVYCVEAKR